MERIEIGTPETIQYRDPELDQTEYRGFLKAAKRRAIDEPVETEVGGEDPDKNSENSDGVSKEK